MDICKGWPRIHEALALHPTRSIMFSPSCLFLSILHFWWSRGLSLWGVIVVFWFHEVTWLIPLFLDTFHKWDYLLVPIWKGVRWLVLFCSILTATLFCSILFNFNSSLVLLAEGTCTSAFACLSPLKEPSASCGLWPFSSLMDNK
jgi:hypothetical protein